MLHLTLIANDFTRASTEIGAVSYLIPHPDTMQKSEWDYFQIGPHIDIRLIPQEGQPGIYEPVAFVSERRSLRAEVRDSPHTS